MDPKMANAAAAAAIAAVSNGKKRRIMIITADESIIEQIQNNNHPSSFQSIYIESQNDNFELSLATVSYFHQIFFVFIVLILPSGRI